MSEFNPDTPVPYELTPEGVKAALPGTLTPEGEAAADAWSRVQWAAQPEPAHPDTWTRAPVPCSLTPRGVEATGPDSRAVITFIERPPLSYLVSLAAGQAERFPEARS